jgi:hypothetical protein
MSGATFIRSAGGRRWLILGVIGFAKQDGRWPRAKRRLMAGWTKARPSPS